MKISLNRIYKTAGVSKQAVHRYLVREKEFSEKLSGLILEADILRTEHPGCGVEKMYHTLRPEWIGRDKFIDVFMKFGYRVQRHKNYHKTTQPVHSKYKNLIQGMMIRDKNVVWQSDITYYQVGDQFYYMVFIIDVYTKKILGYRLSDNLRAEANLKALKMALKNSGGGLDRLIHHSDRGSQYIYKDYTALLEKQGVLISMGEKAQDNAYAERINGTVKNEYLKYKDIRNFNQLKSELNRVVSHYNNKRIHNELPDCYTPEQFEKHLVNLDSQKKPTVIIYADGNYKIKAASSRLDFKPKGEPLAHNCPIEL